MDENKTKKQRLDDFWDISKLVPKSDSFRGHSKPVSTSEIVATPPQVQKNDIGESVIKRYVYPYSEIEKRIGNASFSNVDSYIPDSALIHKVTIKKWNTTYNYYGSFLKDAVANIDTVGKECKYVPFYSYVPQYDQMNKQQLDYYFWFRENERNGIHIKTDSCYILLYIYELLNLGTRLDVAKSQKILTELWNEYHETYPAVSAKLLSWICDFSLLHRLPPPENARGSIVKSLTSLREFFVKMPADDISTCARSLMKYCSSYDFRTSKFVTDENSGFFMQYILGALAVAVKYYSKDDRILSGLTYDDCTLERDVYAGGICVSEQKYRIEVLYCSFSRTNELRYLIGDVIKYSENKLRAYLGIKSKMTVYSVPVKLGRELDNYFENSLPSKRRIKEKRERQEYDALYDVPVKTLSLSDAAKIEAESWNTTEELVAAFDEENESVTEVVFDVRNDADPTVDIECESGRSDGDIWDTFKDYADVIKALLDGNQGAVREYSVKNKKMADVVADEINTISFDIIGDALIEDDGMGNYTVIEDYRYLFE